MTSQETAHFAAVTSAGVTTRVWVAPAPGRPARSSRWPTGTLARRRNGPARTTSGKRSSCLLRGASPRTDLRSRHAHVMLRWRRPPYRTAGLAHVPSTDHLPLPLRGEVGDSVNPIDRPIRWSSDGRRAAPPGRRSRTDCSARQSDRAVAGPSSSRGRPGRLTHLLRAAAKFNPISPRILKRRLPP